MSELVLPSLERRPSSARVLVFIVASLLVHGALVFFISHLPPPKEFHVQKPVELDVVQAKPPPPKVEEEKPKPKVKPIVRIAHLDKPPPDKATPPPPNEEPKEETKPAPVIVGITLSSTSTAGTFAASVGNTMYGKADNKAHDPKDVHNYSTHGKKYVPVYQADSQPEKLADYTPPYPADARHDGVEGVVRLKVTIDETGKVTQAKVLDGPGHGLNEAAVDALLHHLKFKPAMKGGEAVETEITYNFRFELPPGI